MRRVIYYISLYSLRLRRYRNSNISRLFGIIFSDIPRLTALIVFIIIGLLFRIREFFTVFILLSIVIIFLIARITIPGVLSIRA